MYFIGSLSTNNGVHNSRTSRLTHVRQQARLPSCEREGECIFSYVLYRYKYIFHILPSINFDYNLISFVSLIVGTSTSSVNVHNTRALRLTNIRREARLSSNQREGIKLKMILF